LKSHAKLVDAFSNATVVVLGDLVVDEFIHGEISRVSREAPVLILKHRGRSLVPGGAANAIMNLAALGVNVLPVGVVGDDESGRALLKIFQRAHIPVSGVQKIKGWTTVTKTRVLAGHPHTALQQVVRVDREPEHSLDRHTQRELALAARKYALAADAVLVSDYGYGAASPEILNAARSGKRNLFSEIPVTLDSRFRMMQFTGITAVTPNESEVEAALGVSIGKNDARFSQCGNKLMEKMKLESLLITRGRDGMALFHGGKNPLLIPVHGSDEAKDVTGAGDTVIAVFTAALAAGASSEEAARLANVAGGIVVMKRGTATVSQSELKSALV